MKGHERHEKPSGACRSMQEAPRPWKGHESSSDSSSGSRSLQGGSKLLDCGLTTASLSCRDLGLGRHRLGPEGHQGGTGLDVGCLEVLHTSSIPTVEGLVRLSCALLGEGLRASYRDPSCAICAKTLVRAMRRFPIADPGTKRTLQRSCTDPW